MDAKPLTAKVGNWQETVALQKMMNGQVYDPRIRSSSTLTKLRVVAHDEQVLPSEYKSTLNDAIPPQKHRDFVTDDGKGPRQRKLEAEIDEKISMEQREKENQEAEVKNQRFLVTTNQVDFNASNFSSSRMGSNPHTVKRRDPYYVKDAPITYYLHTALHADSFDFPTTAIGDLDKIWAKNTSFTLSSNAIGYGKKSETFENPSAPPTIRELQVLKRLRFDIVTACSSVSPTNARGGALQTLTQKLLDLDTPAGRAPIEDISRVIREYTGVEMTKTDEDAAVVAFSRMNDDRIILIEMIEYLRGNLSMRAKELLYRVWDACNPTQAEFVTEEDVAQGMNSYLEREAMNSILDSLYLYSCGREEGYDLVDLIEYYRDVYAELGDDEDFAALMRATWNI